MRLINQIQNFQDGGYMSLAIKDRKKYITNWLHKKGYAPVQVAAIVGNLQQENHKFDPTIKNSIGATGIAQWLSKGRKDVLLQKNNPYSIETQLEFLHEEIQGKTNSAWTNKVGGKNAFMNAQSVDEATLIFRKDFERPGEHEANDKRRKKYASEAMILIDPNYQPPQFANQAGQGTTPTPTLDELNRISPADIWEMYKDEPSKASELLAFRNEYEESLKKEAQQQKETEVDLQKQALIQAQQQKETIYNLLQQPIQQEEQYNTDIAQNQPINHFRFNTDWFNPQMAQSGGRVSKSTPGSYEHWKKLYNLKESKDYNLRRAYELGYNPDEKGHLPTIDNLTLEFLKAPNHPTINLEEEWFNSDDKEAVDFRSKHYLDKTSTPWRYVSKNQQEGLLHINSSDESTDDLPPLELTGKNKLEPTKPGVSVNDWLPQYYKTPIKFKRDRKLITEARNSDVAKEAGKVVDEILDAPQKAATYLVTNKYQKPSEALVENNYLSPENKRGQIAADVILDPLNLLPISKSGIGIKAEKFFTTSDKVINGVVKGSNAYDNFGEITQTRKEGGTISPLQKIKQKFQ